MDNVKFIGPSILPDTEQQFLSEMLVVIQHADPGYHITIDKRDEYITAHVKPSDPCFKQDIINNLLYFNRKKQNHRLHFSNSLAISNTISFKYSKDRLV